MTANPQLHCVNGCALQRQANPPTPAELVAGAFAVCGRWLVSREAAQHTEPSCVDCRGLLAEKKAKCT
jgi:hypothetical protein